MKLFTLSTILLLLQIYSTITFAQCPEFLEIVSQKQIDEFALNYPNCIEIQGWIRISDTLDSDPITNLLGLQQLEIIDGLVIDDNDALLNLQGLEQLKIIRSLEIEHNDALLNVQGLQNANALRSIGIRNNEVLADLSHLPKFQSPVNNIKIWSNPVLTDLSGLESIRSIKGGLDIKYNESLINLNGLEKLDSVISIIQIHFNEALVDLSGLEGVKSVSTLDIQGNKALVNLSALKNLSRVNEIVINGNSSLISLSGLENINDIDYGFRIGSEFMGGNTALTTLANFKNLKRIGGGLTIYSNLSLIDLNGLDSLEFIGNLKISGNKKLSSLLGLQNLNEIDGDLELIRNESLTNLSGLENLKKVNENIIIGDTDYFDPFPRGNWTLKDISGLRNIDSIGGYLQIEDNIRLTNLLGLEGIQTINDDCIIFGNKSLTNILGFKNLNSVGGNLSIENNEALMGLIGLEQLSNVKGDLSITNNDALINLNGLEQLSGIGGDLSIISNDSLTNLNSLKNLLFINGHLGIRHNDVLNDLSGLENIKSGISELTIQRNVKLSDCSIKSVCDFLAATGERKIEKNLEGCNDELQIALTCEGFAQIKSQIFYDVNQNKIKEENEPLMQSGSVKLDPGSVNVIQNSSNGYGIYYVAPGEYTVSLNEASLPQWNSTSETLSYMLNLAEGACDTILFGVYPKEIQSEIQTYINAPATRCNDTIAFAITAKNSGTSFAEGTLWFEADINSTVVAPFIDEPDTLLPPNQFGWFYADLPPSYSLSKKINLRIPGPENFEVGDSLSYKSFTVFNDENGPNQSDSLTYKTELQCSYDPNDKLVHPQRTCNYTLLDETINYTIRFQNTGNDVALKAVVTDLLDVNLDASTFQLIGSSHLDVLNTSITSRGLLTFEFNEINLPDSTSNVQDSQGYVSYTIKAKSNVEEYTLIENSANIFFDYNPPITTNTVQNVVVSSLYSSTICLDADGDGLGDPNQNITHCGEPPLGYANNCSDDNDAIVDVENSTYLSINIYPNPNNGIFKIEGIESDKISIRIYNSLGHQVTNGTSINPNNNFINFRHLSNGIYYAYIQLEKQVIRKKLVVLN